MDRRGLRLLGGLGLLALAAGAVLLAKPWASQAVALSPEALRQAVAAQYPGSVQQIKRDGGLYVVLLETKQGRYEIKAEANSGEIVHLERLEAFVDEAPPAPALPIETSAPPSAPPPSPEPSGSGSEGEPSKTPGKPPGYIGASRAQRLAAAHVPGGTPEEAELKRTKSGDAYYLVEVEVENGKDADVQVNAVSGKIMSVIWDEDDEP